MCSPKIVAFIVGTIYALFVYFLFSANLACAQNISAFILPVLTLAYLCNIRNRSLFFVLFLVLYSISDLMVLVSNILSYELNYYIGNALYVFAYISLTIDIGRNISLSYIVKNYMFSVIVLFALNCFISYKIAQIIYPFMEFDLDYMLEITYNISMLIVLSTALLNYLYIDSRKAFYFLIGGVCLVFAEVLDVAYLYVSRQNLFNFFTVTLKLVGFYFLYWQARLKYTKQEKLI